THHTAQCNLQNNCVDLAEFTGPSRTLGLTLIVRDQNLNAVEPETTVSASFTDEGCAGVLRLLELSPLTSPFETSDDPLLLAVLEEAIDHTHRPVVFSWYDVFPWRRSGSRAEFLIGFDEGTQLPAEVCQLDFHFESATCAECTDTVSILITQSDPE
ncbi:MAG: hypothetical protein KC561_01055, partial [Myxococcales bacterium]|nr:hypothetical protein [Myxococcales bacterium]